MAASSRDDIDLVIGYDLGDEVSYSAFTLVKRHADGTLEVLESEKVPGPITRGQLLNLCLSSVRKYRPRLLGVMVANGKIIPISDQTVEEILNGTKDWSDLMIGH